ncbi:MAG: DUF1549 domain-containing protein [Planctomycetia bacterium]|nr:DUF1549 domain-containing protein [Planctomycetia bacterium]
MTRLLLLASILSAAVARAAAPADEVVALHAYPPGVRLDSARDRQRVIVQETLADGRTRDVTDRAACTLLAPQLAAVEALDGGLLFRPLADGEGLVRISHGGRTVEIPLVVVSATSDPPLSFRLDVMPVFARGGCNMGSCHGAARGKDGFRLSLFGFDPAGDYQRITRELPGRRIDLANPEESLLVRKAVGTAPHTGGKRFTADSLLARTLVDWIAAGAPDDPTAVPRLVGLDLHPPQALLEGAAATQRLVAVARFADGTDRDVTDLVWYGSNNDQSAKVSVDGRITSGDRGEAFIMARYDTITVGVPVVVIPTGLGPTTASAGGTPGGNWIDDLVDAKLAALRITPSAVCDDATFLRRVMLDVVGLLPTAAEREAFLADTSADKRARLVDRLLTREEFVDLWVMKWADMLQIRSQNNVVSPKGAILYHHWLEQRIAANQPVDQMVRDLLTASGGTFENPPTNYFQLERNTLKLAENVAQAFLGMRIQCAQCHNHPFDRWTMDDYYGFAAFFPQIGRKRAADPRETIIYDAGSGDVKHPVTGQTVAPKFLGGEVPRVADRDRREALAAWITTAENPYFAKHVANLAWTHFHGRGIVHEPDDARVSNPPSNGPLLDELGRRFAASGWDFRSLVREILLSETYQRSCETNPSNALDNTNFSHAAVRRIRAEVLLDVLTQVTETRTKFPGLPQGGRAVEVADGRTTNYFLTTFGRATREDVCTCAVRMDPSLSQALHLLNGDAANDRIAQGKLVPRLLTAGMTPTAVLDELFVRCYGRLPNERERQETIAMVLQAPDPRQALEDVFWALLNSPEFVFNH